MNACAPLLLVVGALGGRADEERAAPDFLLQVEPLLQRAGCASAYCHGSATGRGGFKLSLFGSNPDADHAAIARELSARRVDLVRPEQSLLLRKPARRLPHGGGKVLPEGGAGYALLRDWIAAGAPGPVASPAAAEPISLVRDGAHVRVLRGGEDVTALSLLSSSDDRVAAVANNGTLTLQAPGAAWLFARYAGHSARLAVVQPFGGAPPVEPAGEPLDRAWLQGLTDLGLGPAAAASANTLVRRLHLDLVGRPPAPIEVRDFLRADPATRVAVTVDRLLATPAFAATFAGHLARWLEVPAADAPRGQRLRALCAAAVAHDRLEELWQEVTVQGPRHELVARFGDPRDRAEFVGRAFLGTRIGCARCHDHPLDRWKQAEHLAFAACFADPRPLPGGGMGTGPGVLFDPESGRPVTPRALPLGREQFARALANRVVAVLIGRGLVEPLDDHRLTNPAVHEPVLELLTQEALASHGSLRALVRRVVTSRWYACGSEPPEDGARGDAMRRAFAVREARQAPSELLTAMLGAVLGVPLPAALSASPLPRQLGLLNGPLLRGTVDRGGTQLDALVDLGGDAREQLEELWLLALSRLPREAERDAFLPELERAGDRRAAVRDLACALLLGREFGSLR